MTQPTGTPGNNQAGPYQQGQPHPPQYQGQPGPYPQGQPGPYPQGQPQGAPTGSVPPGPGWGNAPQGQWPPYQQPYQAPAKKPGKAGKVLAIIGAALLVVGIALAALFTMRLVGSVPSAADLTRVDGPTEVAVSGDAMKVIYASDSSTSCSVQAPDGQTPDLRLSTGMRFTAGDVEYTAIGKIGGAGQAAGTYVVECDSSNAVLGPPLKVSDVTVGVLGLVVGIGVGVVGLILLVVGLVLRAVSRKRA